MKAQHHQHSYTPVKRRARNLRALPPRSEFLFPNLSVRPRFLIFPFSSLRHIPTSEFTCLVTSSLTYTWEALHKTSIFSVANLAVPSPSCHQRNKKREMKILTLTNSASTSAAEFAVWILLQWWYLLLKWYRVRTMWDSGSTCFFHQVKTLLKLVLQVFMGIGN